MARTIRKKISVEMRKYIRLPSITIDSLSVTPVEEGSDKFLTGILLSFLELAVFEKVLL